MEPTIKSGRQSAEHVDISGSCFHNVNLCNAEFNDVNMSNSSFHNINFSNVSISAAQIGGAKFRHIGPPPDKNGKQDRQKGVLFEEVELNNSIFRKSNLSNVQITDCNIKGMVIDGIAVKDMFDAYRKQY